MSNKYKNLIHKNDPEISLAIKNEEYRQETNIELIASENYASLAVMAAQGSKLTNKYAEGYPNNRYYGGCKYIDVIEHLAINRVKRLFKAEEANVQPHSGSQANQSVFFAILNPGDTIMGMNISHGGHLTHGSIVNISGKWFNSISYKLNDSENIDYNKIEYLAKKYKPKLIIAGSSSFSLQINFKYISIIAKSINAYFMTDISHYAGLIAAGIYPNPVPFSDFVTTTTHKSLRGPRGGVILMKSKFKKKINSSVFPGIQGGPLMHIIAAKAIAFKEALSKNFISYQNNVLKNAKKLSNELIKYGFKIISGRTESHMMLIDLKKQKITGKSAELLLNKANIIINKNSIPDDKKKPTISSGIRIGTLAITTRGFKIHEIKKIAKMLYIIINNPTNIVCNIIKKKVIKLTKKFPIYN